MRCPKCNSDNMQVQAKEYKPKITVPFLISGACFGCVFGGLGGSIVGILIAGVAAAIINAVLPQTYRGVMICQQCGFVGTSDKLTHVTQNPLFCPMADSNLMVVRKASSTGSVCVLKVTIDGSNTFDINNGDIKYLRLEQGRHTLSYYQFNGMGKKDRTGSLDITIDDTRRFLQFEFLKHGMNVITQ